MPVPVGATKADDVCPPLVVNPLTFRAIVVTEFDAVNVPALRFVCAETVMAEDFVFVPVVSLLIRTAPES